LFKQKYLWVVSLALSYLQFVRPINKFKVNGTLFFFLNCSKKCMITISNSCNSWSFTWINKNLKFDVINECKKKSSKNVTQGIPLIKNKKRNVIFLFFSWPSICKVSYTSFNFIFNIGIWLGHFLFSYQSILFFKNGVLKRPLILGHK
jgi:hypothetical protein